MSIKYRIVEKVYEDRSLFHPEWYVTDPDACNHGWNPVHDNNLMTLPTISMEEAYDRIISFNSAFTKQKVIKKIIHDIEVL